MYIIGKLLNENEFSLCYAVFKNKSDVDNYIQNHPVFEAETLSVIAFPKLEYPFFLLQDSHQDMNQDLGNIAVFYKPITKEELHRKIKEIERVNNFETIYFNLFRVEKDIYNNKFPDESIGWGSQWHLHFMDHDFRDIAYNGFDKYWEDILEA